MRHIYVNSYLDAPKTARYILRKQENCWILEEYRNGSNMVLKEFPANIGHDKEPFASALAECAKIVGHSILYVEEPVYRRTDVL